MKYEFKGTPAPWLLLETEGEVKIDAPHETEDYIATSTKNTVGKMPVFENYWLMTGAPELFKYAVMALEVLNNVKNEGFEFEPKELLVMEHLEISIRKALNIN